MSSNARIGVVIALVAVAALAFVVLKPSDDDGDDNASTNTSTQTTAPQTTTTTTPTTATTPTTVPPKVKTIVIKDGKAVGGIQPITVSKGDRIRFKVTSDAPWNVHLHGYDIEKPVAPGAPASYSLPADIPGVFEVEIEDTSTQIAKLTVNP
jgi:hypothetical protein